MSKGSSPSSITSTQSAEPSDFIRPYLTQAMDYNQDLFESDMPNYFPNATYVGYSPETETSLELARRRAVAGNPLLNQSQTQASSILSGDYLDPTTNPYTQGLFDQMAGEREIMANTMNTAPALGEMDYNDIQKLGQVGVDKESLEQAKLDDAIKRYDFEQQKPYIKLQEYLGNLGANYAQNQVSTDPVTRDRIGGLLGGAGSGINIANQLGMNPMYGAIGGGLLGGFF